MMSVNVEKTRCGILYFLGQTKRLNLLFCYLCVHLYHVVDAEQSGEISTVVRSHVIYLFLFSGVGVGVRWC